VAGGYGAVDLAGPPADSSTQVAPKEGEVASSLDAVAEGVPVFGTLLLLWGFLRDVVKQFEKPAEAGHTEGLHPEPA